MTTYIALFRSLNVGGKNRLPMKELVAVLENVGAREIKTYIQSGNAVFFSRQSDPKLLSDKITAAVKKARGFEPYVLVLELEDLESAIRNQPFPEALTDQKTLHAGFLASVPSKPNLARLETLKSNSERFQLIDKVFYLHAPECVGRSKLAAGAEKLLGVPMTDRNWRTVCKLRDMATER
jgi:uncharacterized protein (DUF1697 family)